MTAHAPHQQPGLKFGLFGVPVRVDPSFFIIIGMFSIGRLSGFSGVAGVISWFVAVFFSLLIHEMGHAVAFRRFSLKPSITLYAMGGLTSAQGRMSWGRSLISSLAGPVSGLVFGGIIWQLHRQGIWTQGTLFERVLYDDLLWVNIGWGLVNLLPLHPLDGGQSLEATLGLLKVSAAARKTSIVSIVVAGSAAAYALYLNSFFLVAISAWLGWTNVKRLQAMQAPPTGPRRAA